MSLGRDRPRDQTPTGNGTTTTTSMTMTVTKAVTTTTTTTGEALHLARGTRGLDRDRRGEFPPGTRFDDHSAAIYGCRGMGYAGLHSRRQESQTINHKKP